MDGAVDGNPGGQDAPRREPVYFPNLDSLRFLAALLVFVFHVELRFGKTGLEPADPATGFRFLGMHGVAFFYVLSGFLITYLLLVERERTGRIDALRFYARRALRIWPLYIVVVLLGLFVLPEATFVAFSGWPPVAQERSGLVALLLFAMAPNLLLALYPPIPYLAHTWSIGVEEQFYLAWPAVLRLHRNPLVPLAAVILACAGADAWFDAFPPSTPRGRTLERFLALTRFDCMACGGLAAWAVLRRPGLLRPLQGAVQQAAAWAVAVLVVGTRFERYPDERFLGLLFAILVVNMACAPRPLFSLEYAPLIRLGRISYGIYMLHPLALGLAFRWLPVADLHSRSPLLARAAVYGAGFALTVALAAGSWRLIEGPCLRWKGRFTTVASGGAGR